MDNKDRKTPVYLGVLKCFGGAGSKAFIIFLKTFGNNLPSYTKQKVLGSSKLLPFKEAFQSQFLKF
tara:strand:- start:14 stop:211 length:198 start_codon:yes stop_codon:yes gene_type:complete